MVLTFLLQTATKLTLKTAVHQEKSEAEESSSDGELLRQHFPPYFSPTRATYKWGKQPSSNTGRELCYSEWRSVIQRVPQHRRNCRTKRFPTSPRISRSILHSYSKVLCHRAQRKKFFWHQGMGKHGSSVGSAPQKLMASPRVQQNTAGPSQWHSTPQPMAFDVNQCTDISQKLLALQGGTSTLFKESQDH